MWFISNFLIQKKIFDKLRNKSESVKKSLSLECSFRDPFSSSRPLLSSHRKPLRYFLFETSRFSFDTPSNDSLRVSDEKLGASNANLGVSNEILGSPMRWHYVSPLRMCVRYYSSGDFFQFLKKSKGAAE